MFDAPGTQHVTYSTIPSGVFELWGDVNGWHYNDLTAAANAPVAAANTAIAAYMFDAQGTQHVDYIGHDGNIYEPWCGWNPKVDPKVVANELLRHY